MKTIATEVRPNELLKQIISKILVADDKDEKKERRDELIKYLKAFY